ncbi:chaperonin 10-like protein [Pyronema omphalodes]|nr:chaperonin 10-like protein [Pyronema omphalodes]
MATTMKAVVFDGIKSVSIQDRPIPKILEPTDAILQVTLTALCGSELHVFRGHQKSATGFIMGHEFTGTVVEVGDQVRNFKKGDTVVSPFTTSCGECFYCTNQLSSRCAQVKLFGCPLLDGGQAEYVRVPLADGTLFSVPSTIEPENVILMADIFPTGFFAAKNAFASLPASKHSSSVAVVIGCGPVGLCAIVAALEYKPKKLFAIDSVASRLQQAAELGDIVVPLNFAGEGGVEAVKAAILEATENRGADVVMEVVGLSPALRTAFEIVRPFGMISSVGVHNAEIPITGNEAYGKNVKIQFGRCPVRAMFDEALPVLAKNQDKLKFMTNVVEPLENAVEMYKLFDEMKVQKVVFKTGAYKGSK